MTEYEFYQVSFQRFKSENVDGTGRRMIIDEKTVRCKVNDATPNGIKMKAVYREVKKGLS